MWIELCNSIGSPTDNPTPSPTNDHCDVTFDMDAVILISNGCYLSNAECDAQNAFLEDLIERIYDPDNVRVAVILYSEGTEVVVGFDNTREEALDIVENIICNNASGSYQPANIAAGLEDSISYFDDSSDNSKEKKLITINYCNPEDVFEDTSCDYIDDLSDREIEVLVVNAGMNIDDGKYQCLVNDPIEDYFEVDNIDDSELKDIVEDLQDEVCSFPTPSPTPIPSNRPTNSPSADPTKNPTKPPSIVPTDSPTRKPSPSPTDAPTGMPTKDPTTQPSPSPTESPTGMPTGDPTTQPSPSPTESPTGMPTEDPTKQPSPSPTESPTGIPTSDPTDQPSPAPTETPTDMPTGLPTEMPTPCDDVYVIIKNATSTDAPGFWSFYIGTYAVTDLGLVTEFWQQEASSTTTGSVDSNGFFELSDPDNHPFFTIKFEKAVLTNWTVHGGTGESPVGINTWVSFDLEANVILELHYVDCEGNPLFGDITTTIDSGGTVSSEEPPCDDIELIQCTSDETNGAGESVCGEEEAGDCLVWHANAGCDQCNTGTFKLNDDFPCVNCQEYAGEGCEFCDLGGCQMCLEGYELIDGSCGLRYCQEEVCDPYIYLPQNSDDEVWQLTGYDENNVGTIYQYSGTYNWDSVNEYFIHEDSTFIILVEQVLGTLDPSNENYDPSGWYLVIKSVTDSNYESAIFFHYPTSQWASFGDPTETVAGNVVSSEWLCVPNDSYENCEVKTQIFQLFDGCSGSSNVFCDGVDSNFPGYIDCTNGAALTSDAINKKSGFILAYAFTLVSFIFALVYRV